MVLAQERGTPRSLIRAGIVLLAAICAAPSPGAPLFGSLAAAQPEARGGMAGTLPDERIVVKGRQRAYRLVVPERAVREGPVPLLFAFHGFRVDSKDVMPRYTRLDDLARREGFLLVYPTPSSSGGASGSRAMRTSHSSMPSFSTSPRNTTWT